MKRLFLVLVGAMLICAGKAQTLRHGETALVYYSPKTEVQVEFFYTVEIQERGQFADFAEAMLGATDFVKENSTVYTLRDVKAGTVTGTDYSRPHKVNTDGDIPALLTINHKGLLTGYNMPYEAPAPKPKPFDEACHKDKHPCHRSQVAPYPEEVLKAATPLAQANEVAKQIFHIRETRMYLLNGEAEQLPADGESMRLVLEELYRQEQALTELFTGKRHMRREQKTMLFEPSNEVQYLFFSEENGFTDSDNIDANTIEIRMSSLQPNRQAPQKKQKKGPELSQIVYNIPGVCNVEVLYKGQLMAERDIPVAQWGIDVALPKSLFIGKELPKIIFSEKTGNIVSINND